MVQALYACSFTKCTTQIGGLTEQTALSQTRDALLTRRWNIMRLASPIVVWSEFALCEGGYNRISFASIHPPRWSILCCMLSCHGCMRFWEH